VIGALVIIVLAVMAIAWIAVPLLGGRRQETAAPSLEIQEAEARKNAALTALVDIEEELELGKLSAADFDELRAEYERDALRALNELDAPSREDSLEQEIAAMRRQMLCPNCGALRVPGESCTKCNARA
jgi:cytochrome c-type biogenesis protein CcmI